MSRPLLKTETPQIDKFRDLARELECDEDEEASWVKLKRVLMAPKSPRQADDAV